MSKSLSVLVTRPQGQADKLAGKLAELGFNSRVLPLTEILPLDIEPAVEIFDAENTYSEVPVIFVSANAVREGVRQLRKASKQVLSGPILAIGPATAAALSKEGLISEAPASGFKSEDFLTYFDETLANCRRVILVCGQGGRAYLQDSLEERGVRVVRLEVYRRAAPKGIKESFELLQKDIPHIVSLMNGEALQVLDELIENQNTLNWKELPLIVSSERILKTAKELGFSQVFCQKDPTESSLIEFLQQFS